MASRKSKAAGAVIVLALLGALVYAGTASASSPKPTPIPPDLEPLPEPEPEDKGEIKIQPPKDESNWGVFPDGLRDLFDKAEKASGIPGLAQGLLAPWAWGAFRAMQSPVDLGQALILALEHPNLALEFVNDSASEVASSRQGYDNAIKNYPSLKKPKYAEQWRSYGSAGMFDILAGSHVWDLNFDGYTAKEFNMLPAQALNSLKVGVYMATIIARRIMKSPNYKVLLATPRETWTAFRQVTANPSAFLQKNNYSKQVGERFQMRAAEVGIDLDKVQNPTLADLKSWPGAKAVYKAIVG